MPDKRGTDNRGSTVLHFIITHTVKMVCPDPRIPCYGSVWLYCSALQFLRPAPEALADIKTTIFYNAFCLVFLPLGLHTIPFKISFVVTWLSRLLHCIIFQIRIRNNKLTDYHICCLLFFCF